MSFKYFFGGVQRGSTEFSANYDGLTLWTTTFSVNTALSNMNSLEVEVEDLWSVSAIHLQNLTATVTASGGGGGKEPDPHQE